MGILRADRITGLGGANAISGSVFFAHDGSISAGESGALQVHNENDALTFGTGDWTVEFWFYTDRLGVVQSLYDGRGTGAGTNTAVYIRLSDANKIQFFTTNAFRITGSTTIIAKSWYHVALTRTGSTHTLYVNGSSDGTYSNANMDYTGPTNNLASIGSDDNGYGAYGLNGYISNLRVAKELIYSAAFTVPTTALAPTSNTTLLCCQSPGNVNASFGDPILTAYASNINSKGPVASRFTPNTPVGFSTTTDVGSQYGTTFDGVGSFATSTYMVPPGGNTRERNRGRAVFGGGANPSVTDYIDYVHIPSGGNAITFGNLINPGNSNFGLSSSTRGIWAGGRQPTPSNVIEFITLANTANTTDFGDLTQARHHGGSASNSTRGVFMAGGNPSGLNVMDYVTIATTGNATDFGDTLTTSITTGGGRSSSTRGILAGLMPSSPTIANTIEFITIATTGNSQDFGDLTLASRGVGAGNLSSGTRAVLMGGYTDPAFTNVISFVTIASAGNATDFGDISSARAGGGTASTLTKGVLAGGRTPTDVNTIDAIIIATTGNSTDFGDLTQARAYQPSGCSDSHGGLS